MTELGSQNLICFITLSITATSGKRCRGDQLVSLCVLEIIACRKWEALTEECFSAASCILCLLWNFGFCLRSFISSSYSKTGLLAFPIHLLAIPSPPAHALFASSCQTLCFGTDTVFIRTVLWNNPKMVSSEHFWFYVP